MRNTEWFAGRGVPLCRAEGGPPDFRRSPFSASLGGSRGLGVVSSGVVDVPSEASSELSRSSLFSIQNEGRSLEVYVAPHQCSLFLKALSLGKLSSATRLNAVLDHCSRRSGPSSLPCF